MNCNEANRNCNYEGAVEVVVRKDGRKMGKAEFTKTMNVWYNCIM